MKVPATALLFSQNFVEAETGAGTAVSAALDFALLLEMVTVGPFFTAGPATVVAGFAVTVGKALDNEVKAVVAKAWLVWPGTVVETGATTGVVANGGADDCWAGGEFTTGLVEGLD